MDTATASFVIDSWDETPYDDTTGTRLSRARVTKTFSGEVEGTSVAELLLGVVEGGAMAYSAFERLDVAVHERRGTFVLHHNAGMTAAGPTATWTVLDGSGTGGLTGLAGSATIERHEDGSHTFVLDATLPLAE